MLKEDRRSEPRVKERVPYVVVYGSPGLPLIRLVRRSVTLHCFDLYYPFYCVMWHVTKIKVQLFSCISGQS